MPDILERWAYYPMGNQLYRKLLYFSNWQNKYLKQQKLFVCENQKKSLRTEKFGSDLVITNNDRLKKKETRYGFYHLQ